MFAILDKAEFFSPWLPVAIKITLSLLYSAKSFSFKTSKLSMRFSSIAVVIALLILLPTTNIFFLCLIAFEITVFNLAIFDEKQVTIILPVKLSNNRSKDGSNSDSDLEISFTPALVESPINKSIVSSFSILKLS